MPLMREVIVGFFGLSNASPFARAPFAGAGALVGGGTARFVSDCECCDEAVETEGAGEGAGVGFAEVLEGLLASAGAAMVVTTAASASRVCSVKGDF
jgi:hypothetical protein